MSTVPKSSWPWVKTLLHSVYDQPDAESVHSQFDRVLDALEHKLPKAFAHLDTAVLAEQHDECAESRRNLGLDALTKSQTVGTTQPEEVTLDLHALSA